MHDTPSNNSRLVAPVAGVYRVWGVAPIATAGSGSLRAFLQAEKNGSTVVGLGEMTEVLVASGSAAGRITLGVEVQLAASDYLELVFGGYNVVGTPTLSIATGDAQPTFGMSFVSRVS
jgi:hypothetical protein